MRARCTHHPRQRVVNRVGVPHRRWCHRSFGLTGTQCRHLRKIRLMESFVVGNRCKNNIAIAPPRRESTAATCYAGSIACSSAQYGRSKRRNRYALSMKQKIALQANKTRNKAQTSRVVEYVSAQARYRNRHSTPDKGFQ